MMRVNQDCAIVLRAVGIPYSAYWSATSIVDLLLVYLADVPTTAYITGSGEYVQGTEVR